MANWAIGRQLAKVQLGANCPIANWRQLARLDWIGDWPDEPDFFGLDWRLVGQENFSCPIGPPCSQTSLSLLSDQGRPIDSQIGLEISWPKLQILKFANWQTIL